MRVKRVGYVGMHAKDVEDMTSFLRDVLGLEPGGEQEGMTFQKLPTNDSISWRSTRRISTTFG